MRSHSSLVSKGDPSLGKRRSGFAGCFPKTVLPFAEDVAFYGVVGGVDLRRDPLCADALLGVGETVGVEALDQLPALPVHLVHGGAGSEAQPVVGGEDFGGVAQRG